MALESAAAPRVTEEASLARSGFLVVTEASTGRKFSVAQGPDGWEVASDGSKATLNGATCNDALGGRFSNVSFEFGCVDAPLLR